MKKIIFYSKILLLVVFYNNCGTFHNNEVKELKFCSTSMYELIYEHSIKLTKLYVKSKENTIIPNRLFSKIDSTIGKINYENLAVRAGVKGMVILEFQIDSSGKTNNLKLLKGIGEICDTSVINSINKLSYLPTTENFEIPSVLISEIQFKIGKIIGSRKR